MLQKIKDLADQFQDQALEIRRYLHQHPELSFREFKTAEYVEKILRGWELDVERVAETGLTGLIHGSGPGPCVVVRADLDALPIQEENTIAYRSVHPSVMHACGHDVHTASLLGAIWILHQLKSEFQGTVRYLFQPGEELLPGGAVKVIGSGILNNPKPDAIIAQHVYPELPAGSIGMRSGAYMASSDEIYLEIIGRGGHAAMPHTLIDPILISSHLIISLQQVVSRHAPPEIPTVLSFGKVDAPGATNVIPDRVWIEGTFRTMDETWRTRAYALIRNQAGGLVKAMGGELNCRIVPGYRALHNNPELTEKAGLFVSEYLGHEQVIQLPIRMGAEDFARYGEHIPALFYRLGTGGEEAHYPIHTSRFNVDETSLKTGTGLLAWIAINLLSR